MIVIVGEQTVLLIVAVASSGKFTDQNLYTRENPSMKELDVFKYQVFKLSTYFDSFSVLIKYFMVILLKIKCKS